MYFCVSKKANGLPLSVSVNNTKGVLRYIHTDNLRRQKPNCNAMFTARNCGGFRYPLTNIVCGSAFAVLHSGKEIFNA